LLAPVSWLWAAVARFRNRRFDRRGGVLIDGATIISVGNLAVGGTGKTPVASWMVRVLSNQGAKPAVILSGYGRDEELLHRRWTPNAQVFAGPDRVRGARAARGGGANVIVLDDGFQHRHLARSLDVVLLAVEDRFPGRVLPTGPYRESPRALVRADAIILTRRVAPADAARKLEATVSKQVRDTPIASLHLADGSLRSLEGDAVTDHLDEPLVVTAIARPDSFLTNVARFSRGGAGLLAYRDHHEFTEDDARTARKRAGHRPIVMTEKDAVKLFPYSSVLGDAWVVEQRLVWDWGEEQILDLLPAAQAWETQ
jgi:tetraacyldisaccharide 4'-kinase